MSDDRYWCDYCLKWHVVVSMVEHCKTKWGNDDDDS